MEPAGIVSPGVRAIVLAGGTARRLGGVDKLALAVGGVRLLDRVLTPLAALGWPAVVVGPQRPVAAGLPQPVWTRESPIGGGPAAGLAAGLATLPEPGPSALVAVLAGDLPHLRCTALADLARAAAGAVAAGDAGALAVDDDGIDQLLLGVWSVAALRAAVGTDVAGGSLRAVLPRRRARVALGGLPAPWSDCDTDVDLARARALATATATAQPAVAAAGR